MEPWSDTDPPAIFNTTQSESQTESFRNIFFNFPSRLPTLLQAKCVCSHQSPVHQDISKACRSDLGGLVSAANSSFCCPSLNRPASRIRVCNHHPLFSIRSSIVTCPRLGPSSFIYCHHTSTWPAAMPRSLDIPHPLRVKFQISHTCSSSPLTSQTSAGSSPVTTSTTFQKPKLHASLTQPPVATYLRQGPFFPVYCSPPETPAAPPPASRPAGPSP